jgi:hypothetical protein
MRLLTLTALPALCLLFVLPAFAMDVAAEDTTTPKEKPGQQRTMKFDGDGDGALSRAEWQARSENAFKEIDRNGDGKATREEMRDHRKTKRAEMKSRIEERKAKREERTEQREQKRQDRSALHPEAESFEAPAGE